MRLSADVISACEQRPNPLGEREIVLRGLGVPTIEHLATTRDQFDAIDLSHNNLVRLENFPRLLRLTSLYAAGNAVEGLDRLNVAKNLPNLTNLILADNKISRLSEVKALGGACPKLEFLILRGNPVTRRQHYRLYTVHQIPTLKVLDFVRVKQPERDRARRLATSAAGAALEGDVRIEAREAARAHDESDRKGVEGGRSAAIKTFEPGEDLSGGVGAPLALAGVFTSAQRERIRSMVSEAGSPEEIEKIESCVRRGVFPGGGEDGGNDEKMEGKGPSSPPPLMEDGGQKRAAESIVVDSEEAEKRSRVE